jgi:hypothetical protein
MKVLECKLKMIYLLNDIDLGDNHGLINYTDTKAFVSFSLKFKTERQENFPALICHSSRRKCIHLPTVGWGWQDTEIAAKSL